MVDPLNTKAIEAAKSAVIGNPLNDEQIHRMISAYLSTLPAVDGGEFTEQLLNQIEHVRLGIAARFPDITDAVKEALRLAEEASSLILSQKGEIERLTTERDEYRTAVSSPEAVIANMKRGAIAVPSIRFLIDLHGESALSTWDKASAAESRVLSLEEALRNLAEAVDCEVDIGGKSGVFRKRVIEARSALQEKQNG